MCRTASSGAVSRCRTLFIKAERFRSVSSIGIERAIDSGSKLFRGPEQHSLEFTRRCFLHIGKNVRVDVHSHNGTRMP
jgi:hypothetical protein